MAPMIGRTQRQTLAAAASSWSLTLAVSAATTTTINGKVALAAHFARSGRGGYIPFSKFSQRRKELRSH